MNDEERLAGHAASRGTLGEEFFAERMRSLRASVEEREQQIAHRAEIHGLLLHGIDQGRTLKLQRLRLLAMSYAHERTELMREIEGLSREERAEMVRFHADVARWSKEAREKQEEYEGMAQLFRALAIEGEQR